MAYGSPGDHGAAVVFLAAIMEVSDTGRDNVRDLALVMVQTRKLNNATPQCYVQVRKTMNERINEGSRE